MRLGGAVAERSGTSFSDGLAVPESLHDEDDDDAGESEGDGDEDVKAAKADRS